MALSATQVQKLQAVKAAVQKVVDAMYPESQGRDTLSIMKDFAGGWVMGPELKDALVKLDEVLNEG